MKTRPHGEEPTEQQQENDSAGVPDELNQPVWNLIRLDGIKVLLVEDVPDARALIGRILVRSGATVLGAESAQEARNVLSMNRPDVIVSDIAMPDEDGLAFLRKLRAEHAVTGERIPAIALTAFTDEMTRRQIFKAGFEMHVGKGSSSEILLRAMFDLTAGAPPTVH